MMILKHSWIAERHTPTYLRTINTKAVDAMDEHIANLPNKHIKQFKNTCIITGLEDEPLIHLAKKRGMNTNKNASCCGTSRPLELHMDMRICMECGTIHED